MIKYIFSIFLFFSICHANLSQLVIDKYDNVELTAYINKISIDDQNYIWVCTSNGISKIGNIESAPDLLLQGKNINSITHDPRLGTFASDGYQIYQIRNNKTFDLDNEGIIINDVEIFKGSLYVGTNKGLYIVNVKTERIEIKNTRNSKLKSNYIHFVHQDEKNLLRQKGHLRLIGHAILEQRDA